MIDVSCMPCTPSIKRLISIVPYCLSLFFYFSMKIPHFLLIYDSIVVSCSHVVDYSAFCIMWHLWASGTRRASEQVISFARSPRWKPLAQRYAILHKDKYFLRNRFLSARRVMIMTQSYSLLTTARIPRWMPYPHHHVHHYCFPLEQRLVKFHLTPDTWFPDPHPKSLSPELLDWWIRCKYYQPGFRRRIYYRSWVRNPLQSPDTI